MNLDSKRNIRNDTEEVLSYIIPFYETFYSNREELFCNTIFRKKQATIRTTNNYSVYYINIPGNTNEEYCINFNKNIIVYSSKVEDLGFHSEDLNFPAHYEYNFKNNDLVSKLYYYHGFGLKHAKIKEWMGKYNLKDNNWEASHYLLFLLEIVENRN